MEEIKKIDLSKIHFSDECGMDNDDVLQYGWAKKGLRIFALKPGFRTQRISLIAALNKKKIHSPFVFEGYTNRDIFATYLEKVLLPNLQPGDYVVLDNARFHKGIEIDNLFKNANCTVIYLPPYSPDLNPIEHYWHSIKNSMRKLSKIADRCLIQSAEILFSNVGNLL